MRPGSGFCNVYAISCTMRVPIAANVCMCGRFLRKNQSLLLTTKQRRTMMLSTCMALFPEGPAEKLKKSAVPRQYNLTFQENTSMKKMLLVITVVLVGSLAASAAPVVFNFQFDGFCDNMQTHRYTPGSPVPKKLLAGIHDLTSGCGGITVAVGGFQHGNPTAISPFVAPVNDYSDPIEGIYGVPYSLQYLVHEPNALHPACVWSNYFSNSAANYLFYSDLTCTRFNGAAPQGRLPGGSTIKR